VLWIVIALLLVFLFNLFQGTSQRANAQSVSYTQFLQQIDQGEVKKITVQGDSIKGELSNGQQFATTVPSNDPGLWPMLNNHHVNVTVDRPDDSMPTLMGVIVNWFPMLLLIGVWVFFLRQMQAGGGKAMGFGKSRA
jgi:cell division protease FtsH